MLVRQGLLTVDTCGRGRPTGELSSRCRPPERGYRPASPQSEHICKWVAINWYSGKVYHTARTLPAYSPCPGEAPGPADQRPGLWRRNPTRCDPHDAPDGVHATQPLPAGIAFNAMLASAERYRPAHPLSRAGQDDRGADLLAAERVGSPLPGVGSLKGVHRACRCAKIHCCTGVAIALPQNGARVGP